MKIASNRAEKKFTNEVVELQMRETLQHSLTVSEYVMEQGARVGRDVGKTKYVYKLPFQLLCYN